MKQLLVVPTDAYAASASWTDLSSLTSGIAVFDLASGTTLGKTAKATKDFAIGLGRGTGKMPYLFPEVNIDTLEVTKATNTAGATFTAKMTVPTTVAGKHYTILVVKKGTVFNERSNWTFTTVAKGTTAADVAKDLTAQINANKTNSGVGASYTGGAITITATSAGSDYTVKGADELISVTPTDVTAGKEALLDAAYIKDLASRCAAGKGFNYLAEDGKEIYPGYPENVPSGTYVLYTLRFAVPRKSAKQRDEVVYQTVHIAVNTATSSTKATEYLDVIFGLTTPTTGGGGGGGS